MDVRNKKVVINSYAHMYKPWSIQKSNLETQWLFRNTDIEDASALSL